jgi:hypothetical protein
MHVDYTGWPFVPHNLISAQYSPVPLPKFQLAPRLKILISSGFQEKNPDVLSFSLKKSRQTNAVQISNAAPIERDTSVQGILRIS